MEPSRPKRRSFTAPLVTLFAAIVLTAGSCFGFLNTFSMDGAGKHPNLNVFYLIVFCICVMVFPATIIWMIARAVRNSGIAERGDK